MFIIVVAFALFLLSLVYDKATCEFYNLCDNSVEAKIGYSVGRALFIFVGPLLAAIATFPCLITSALFIGIRKRKKDLSTKPYIIPFIISIIVFVVPVVLALFTLVQSVFHTQP